MGPCKLKQGEDTERLTDPLHYHTPRSRDVVWLWLLYEPSVMVYLINWEGRGWLTIDYNNYIVTAFVIS